MLWSKRMTQRSIVEIMEGRLREYRGWTNTLLAKTPDDWLYRQVDWSECTIGWHMGHLAWKQDSYGSIYFGETQQLDAAWKADFYSEAPLDIATAPPSSELRTTFAAIFERFVAQVAALDDEALTRTDPDWPDGTILGALTNVMVHEGEHLAGIEALRWAFTSLNPAAD